MLIYNITIKVNNAILDDWMQWQQEVHIPEIMRTGLFERYQVFRLLEQEEEDGQTEPLAPSGAGRGGRGTGVGGDEHGGTSPERPVRAPW